MNCKTLATFAVFVALTTACRPGESRWVSPIQFDTATAWFHVSEDSVPLLIEIASDEEQRAFGLSRRPTLDSQSGMLFEFDSLQAAENGFWMWRTKVPLDIAYLDPEGVVQRILNMPLCGSRAESCPTYPPGIPYASTIEANVGWFSERGIEPGTRVTIARD
jgi:uncharacterized membrane protein (UPF0127 family)